MAPVLASAASGRLEMRASKLMGSDVINASGETIGELKDLIFDARDGKIRSAIIEYGGWLAASPHSRSFAPAARHAPNSRFRARRR